MLKTLAISCALLLYSHTFGQIVTLNGGLSTSLIYASYNPSYGQNSDNWYKSEFSRYFNQGPLYFGWNISAGVQYLQRKRFFLSSDLGLNEIGGNGSQSNQSGANPIGQSELKTKLLFVSVNTLANVNFAEKGGSSLYVGLGPRVDFLVDQKMPSTSFIDLYAIPDHLNKVVWGLYGKFGFHQVHKQFQFGTEIGFNYNISQLLNYTTARYGNAPPDTKDDVNFKMNMNYVSVKISVGYVIKDRKSVGE